jgi:hypothetical protein
VNKTMHRIAWAGLLAWCLLGSPASSQVLNFASLEAGENRLTFTMGIDPAILGAVAYTRTVAIGERPVAFSVETAFPVAGLDVRDYRALVGAQMSALHLGRWHAAGQVRLISRGTRNDIFDAQSLGADCTVYLGYYGARRFAALDLGFDKVVATYISHRDWYRDHFYEGAVDGWYSSTGGTWHTGVAGGVNAGLLARTAQAGLHWSEGGNALLPPINGTLSFAYAF